MKNVILEGIKTSSTIFATVVSISLSVTLWYFKPDLKIPILYVIIFIIIVIFTVFSLIGAIKNLSEKIKQTERDLVKFPEIIKVMTEGGSCICLLTNSKLFSYGVYASFYKSDDDGFEDILCIGTVSNIQDNGLIQIKINYWNESYEDEKRSMEQSNSSLLKRIIVKPTLPADFLDSRL